MGIIEKLGITPLKVHRFYADVHAKPSKPYCKTDEVRIVEQQRDEMLEALIESVKEPVKFSWHTTDVINLIEKAAGKTWPEIKELLCTD